MNTYQYILSLIATEQRLKENFIKIAEYYKTEPGIYYGCQEMASISDDHIRKINREPVQHLKNQHEADSERAGSMIIEHEPGRNLAQDLRFMWLLTMEAALYNNLLLQAAINDSEDKPDNIFADFEPETDKQSQWLVYRINMTSRRKAAEV